MREGRVCADVVGVLRLEEIRGVHERPRERSVERQHLPLRITPEGWRMVCRG